MSNEAKLKKYLDSIRNFKTSAIALTVIWDEINNDMEGYELGVENYPQYLPSFDEFVLDIQSWEEKQKAIIKDYFEYTKQNEVKG